MRMNNVNTVLLTSLIISNYRNMANAIKIFLLNEKEYFVEENYCAKLFQKRNFFKRIFFLRSKIFSVYSFHCNKRRRLFLLCERSELPF